MNRPAEHKHVKRYPRKYKKRLKSDFKKEHSVYSYSKNAKILIKYNVIVQSHLKGLSVWPHYIMIKQKNNINF